MPTPRAARLQYVLPILAFALLLIWGWRVSDPINNLPSPEQYGDPFEVLWMVDRVYASLARGELPDFAPDVWHPVGMQLGALGYTPATFLIMLPFRAVANATFAYNAVTLLGLALCFWATYRLAQRFAGVNVLGATIAALLYTASPFMWERVLNGHINILWAVAILPLFVHALLDFVSAEDDDDRRALRSALAAGVAWGALLTLQLYGMWWGALAWIVAVVATWRRERRQLWRPAIIPALALLLASPTLIYFVVSNQKTQLVTDGLPALVGWGASLNSLVIPSVFHPIEFVRAFATWVYDGIQNESGIANWGLVLSIVGIIGAVIALRPAQSALQQQQRREWQVLLAIAVISFALALGLAVKWNGHPIIAPILAPLDQVIWRVGHALKPGLFVPDQPIPELANSIPGLSYVLAVAMPLWDAARVYARFSFVSGLALALLAALLISRVSRAGRAGRVGGVLLAGLLLFEVLPQPTNNRPVPARAHPVYEWITAQGGQPENGTHTWNILDLSDEPNILPIILGGKVVMAARQHNLAVSSGFGSYPVRHISELRTHLARAPEWAGDMRTPFFMRALRTRYVLVHRIFRNDDRVWEGILASPFFKPAGCFAPYAGDSIWPHEVCVAEALWREGDPINIIPSYDWSPEPWGIWAMGTEAKANWIAERAGPHTISMRAFPSCQPNAAQTMTARVNGVVVGEHTWQACKDAALSFVVPASAVKPGWNDVDFSFGYAYAPPGDTRPLAVGFSELAIR